jgi:TRAP-type mannitol/chloroaromatic compound transport system permease small subunit
MALSSLMQRETTGTPWSPPVWPLKACIPLAGVLLLLQTFSNTMRDIGIIEPRASERDAQGGAL